LLKPRKEGEVRQAKSRYNCRNISKLPSFHIENTTNLLEVQKDVKAPLESASNNNAFKRVAKANKFRVYRRNT
jgi:hypothetical protein